MDGRVMGCMGHPSASSPNLDRLAARGTLFRRAYTNSPQCCPARAALWAGRHVHSLEAWNNYKGIPDGHEVFTDRLARAGYELGVFGKLDYTSGNHSLKARVTAWARASGIDLATKGRPAARVADAGEVQKRDRRHLAEARKWLAAREGASRFYLLCGLGTPHPPFVSSPEWLDRIDPARVTPPAPNERDHPVMRFMRTSKGCAEGFSAEEALAIRRTYFAMIAELDEMIGLVLGDLDRLGFAENTVVIYASDHGEMNAEHGQWLKNAMYDPSSRVPLIVAGPGIEAGAVRDELVSLVDLYPTLMDLADAGKPDYLEGSSLAPLLAGRDDPSRPDHVLSEYHSNFQNTGSFMLVRGDWKYVAYPGFRPQLFSLADDPDELRELAEASPEFAGDMDRALRELVDYETVDARAKEYDRRAFRAWRDALGRAEYLEAMRGVFTGFGEADERRVEAWLDGGPGTRG
jgi:arylsulfatase K